MRVRCVTRKETAKSAGMKNFYGSRNCFPLKFYTGEPGILHLSSLSTKNAMKIRKAFEREAVHTTCDACLHHFAPKIE